MYRLICKALPVFLVCSLIPAAFGSIQPVAYSASLEPVNPDISVEARDVYSYLTGLTGKALITGQHDYLESPDELNNRVKKISGEYSGVHGYELGAISNQTASVTEAQRQNVVASAIRWQREGGIVTMTYHEALPGKPLTWANVQSKLSQAEFNKYVTPGTTQYKNLIADLDQVAESLKQLRDAGVPVLWRPYHEMNGDWFWWGKKKNFNQLWNIMYDRLVHTHQLDNLLWVWSPNAPNAYSDPYEVAYPGADKVDILAVDIYNNDYKKSYYDSLLALAGNKPIAIGENGEMPSPSVLATQPNWVYSMTWGNMLIENNSTEDIRSYMNDSATLTREELAAGMEAAKQLPGTDVPNEDEPEDGTPPVSQPGEVYENGLYAEYFNNENLTGEPALKRKDHKIDFNWRADSPDPTIQPDLFSIRWTGKVMPQYSETYTFTTISDDGIRVWIDGQLVIDSWYKQSWTERRGTIKLTAGQMADIKIEYYDGQGDAMARLMWESQHEAKAVIPQSALFLP